MMISNRTAVSLILALTLAACGPGAESDDLAGLQLGPALPAPVISSSWLEQAAPGVPVPPGGLEVIRMVATRVAAIGCWSGTWAGDVTYVAGPAICAPTGSVYVTGACVQPDPPYSWGIWGSYVVTGSNTVRASGMVGALMAWGGRHCGYVFDDATIATWRESVAKCVDCVQAGGTVTGSCATLCR